MIKPSWTLAIRIAGRVLLDKSNAPTVTRFESPLELVNASGERLNLNPVQTGLAGGMASRIIMLQRLSLTRKLSSHASRSLAGFRSLPAHRGPAVAHASTQANGTGNPSIVDTLPNTSAEVRVHENLSTASNVISSTPLPPQEPFSVADDAGQLYVGDGSPNDWSKSYHGLSAQPFAKEVAEVLQAPIDPLDIEQKPGMITMLCIRVNC